EGDHDCHADRSDDQRSAQLGTRRCARAGPPGRRDGAVHALPASAPRRPRLGQRLSRIALWIVAGTVLVFLLLPLAIVVPTSFSASAYMEFPPRGFSLRWYRNYFSSRAWIEPTLLSVRVAIVTMVLSTVVGTLAAFGIVRGRFRGRRAVEF